MPEPPENAPQQPTYGFEKNVSPMIFTKDMEKTFIDKVLDRKDSERLAELMKKEELNRAELLELLYLIVSINTKLVNFNDWDRYLLGKFLAWIRDFCTLHESLLDYITQFDEMPKPTKPKELQNHLDIIQTLNSIRKYDSHNLKFLVDIYLYLSNSTLSIGGSAFDTLSKNRFEYAYPGMGYSPASPPQKKGIFDWLKRS